MDFIFLWLITFISGFWILKKINTWKNLPPGPWGLPIVGYLPFLDSKQPQVTLTKLSQKYGPIYGLAMGSVYTVVISDHKLIRDAFAREVFSGRAPLFLTRLAKGNGIIWAEGMLWKDQRKLVSSWLKSFGMSKHSVAHDKLAKHIDNSALELLQNIQETSGSAVKLSNMVENTIGNFINDITFGFKFPSEDETWLWFRQMLNKGTHESGVAGVVNFLPFIRFLLPSIERTIAILVRSQEQGHRLYASMIARRRKVLGLEVPNNAKRKDHANIFKEHPEGFIKCVKYSKHGSNAEFHYFDPSVLIASKNECILDSFLTEQKKRFENGEENAYFMRDEQLHYLLGDMFGAGLDTTSGTFSWYLLFMALHQKEQEKVRNEIMSVCPEGCEINISKLPYLTATICETQRIRTVVPVGVPHGCLQDTYLANYRIPKGTMIVSLLWSVYMDPNNWKDPDVFKPSRFIDDGQNFIKPQEFIPFQTGKRMCPGGELSTMILVGFIVRLFRSFRVRLASDPPTPMEMQGNVGITLSAPETLFICEKIQRFRNNF